MSESATSTKRTWYFLRIAGLIPIAASIAFVISRYQYGGMEGTRIPLSLVTLCFVVACFTAYFCRRFWIPIIGPFLAGIAGVAIAGPYGAVLGLLVGCFALLIPIHQGPISRFCIYRSIATLLVLVGLIGSQFIGFYGLWLPGDKSTSEVRAQYEKDWIRALRLSEAEEVNIVVDEIWFREDLAGKVRIEQVSDVRDVRTHGWPFVYAYCAPIRSDMPGHYATSTPWLFDGSELFEFRAMPLIVNVALCFILILATHLWIWRSGAKRLRFGISTLFALVTAFACLMAISSTHEAFYVDEWWDGSHDEHLHVLAIFTLWLTRIATFVGVFCVVAIVVSFASRLTTQSGRNVTSP